MTAETFQKRTALLLVLVLVLVLVLQVSSAFVLPTQQHPSISTSSNTCLGMIGNLLGNDNKSQQQGANLPRDVKDAVSKCRAAVQEALQNKCSRMDVEMPVGAKFGVEKTTNKSKRTAAQDDGAPTQSMLDQSDRELARLFVEMFQPVGAENIAVIFNTANLAELAKKKWKNDYGADSRVLAIDNKKPKTKSGKKKKKSMGFAAKLAKEVEDDGSNKSSGGPFELPGNIEVALFVAPGPKELMQVEKVCTTVGMGTLVVLLNARLSMLQQDQFASEQAETLFTKEFEPVFCLAAAPQQEAPGCLLYRSYPGPWVLARKPKVGPPKPILTATQSDKPTPEQCQEAYESLELGDVEKGIENVLENVAGWFN
ncbi:expressed unknown protein [Seminavis robusta]|uniref:DUF1995 domain-containing protein n=1 Tax=Seminavis robusta TaxID=568900 RepID=A0A9N8DKQ0_9STRA|nr:expressed unknown protein [Seminavis robusta]|eukprot:Sro111_g055120.1 n/a (369) ;mRNA; f:3726-4832